MAKTKEEYRAYCREYYQKNKAKKNERTKRYYQLHPEKKIEGSRKYHQTHKEEEKEYRLKNREKINRKLREYYRDHINESKDSNLRRNYGISFEKYNELFISQNGVCLICSKPEIIKNRTLCVDHCHEDGKVRGLLCSKCNQAIGLFEENPLIFKKAVEYLSKYKFS